MDDVRAVMDAAGSETAALMGVSEGGPLSILFAATYPERTRALVLCGAEVKEETTEDWPWGESTRAEFEEYMTLENVVARWGEGRSAAYLAPSRSDDRQLREWFGRPQVQSASPQDALAFMRMAFEIDVRDPAGFATPPRPPTSAPARAARGDRPTHGMRRDRLRRGVNPHPRHRLLTVSRPGRAGRRGGALLGARRRSVATARRGARAVPAGVRRRRARVRGGRDREPLAPRRGRRAPRHARAGATTRVA